MQITIHRGNQIGGCITRIDYVDDSIVIDMGSNLPEGDCKARNEFSSKDIAEIVNGCNAVLYTHYHGDHIGLMKFIPMSTHEYMGEGMKEVTETLCNRLSRAYTHHKEDKNSEKTEELVRLNDDEHFHTFKPYEVLKYGKIKVTPIPASHSAFDAYMFLIEAEGKKILHTGDFRLHGYYCEDFLHTLTKWAKDIDVLITEGTMINRDGKCNEVHVKSEMELQDEFYKAFLEEKYSFVLCSSTDADRIASVYNAALAAGRHPQIEKGTFADDVLQIFTKRAERRKLYDFNYVERVPRKKKNEKPDITYLNGKKDGFVKLVSSGFFRKDETGNSGFTRICAGSDHFQMIFSIWNGYYEEGRVTQLERYKDVRKLLAAKGHKFYAIHTSGHAKVSDISKVCHITNPKCIIPIHKEAKADFSTIPGIANLKCKIVETSCNINDISIILV